MQNQDVYNIRQLPAPSKFLCKKNFLKPLYSYLQLFICMTYLCSTKLYFNVTIHVYQETYVY